MAVERDPSLPAWLSIEREYDGDDAATAAALVELIRYSEARSLAEQCPPETLAALAAEAGLPPLEVHRAACQRGPSCPICPTDDGTPVTLDGRPIRAERPGRRRTKGATA